jgi:hypothetical protein
MHRSPATRRFEAVAAECVAQAAGGYRVLETPDEPPDAELLRADGYRVGLEVVSVHQELFLETRERVKGAAARIEAVLRERELCTFVDVYFDLHEIVEDRGTAYRKWLAVMPERVASVVHLQPHGRAQREALRAAGIERVAHLEWKRSSRSAGSRSREARGDRRFLAVGFG